MKKMRLKLDIELCLTETERRICERLIHRPATYKQLFSELYETNGRPHQSVNTVSVHLAHLRKKLGTMNIQIKKRQLPHLNKNSGEYYFCPNDVSVISEAV